MTNDHTESSADHASVGTKGDKDIVGALEKTMRAKLLSDTPLSPTRCIFKVPEVFRRQKPEAYKPDVVSIGPLHRGGKQFQPMENVKRWYLHNLLLRCNISLKVLIQGIIDFEQQAREFYAEPLDHLNQNDFIEMMILDGCFLLELFRKFKALELDKNHNINDPIFNMDCMLKFLCHDILLLENQLPWFILERLYCHIVENSPCSYLTLLVLHFYSKLLSQTNNFKSSPGDNETLHILDLIRSMIVFPFHAFGSTYSLDTKLPHATALSEAGVDFRIGSGHSIMNIEFKGGVLTMPKLTILELTEPLFRNLIAFEQCYHGRSPKITSYALLMDNLIGSSKDIDFLCEKKIIDNWLNSEDAAQFFNKLYSDTFVKQFYYGGLCAEVNGYYKITWHKWLEKLKRHYLSNPWKVTSLVAAFILLFLTLLQTTFTIQQYYSPHS